MTIEEVKKLRKETEEAITALLDGFSKQTGLAIESVDCTKFYVFGTGARYTVEIKASI